MNKLWSHTRFNNLITAYLVKALLLSLLLGLFLSVNVPLARAVDYDFEDANGYNQLNGQTAINPAYAAFSDRWSSWTWDNGPACGSPKSPLSGYTVSGCKSLALVTFNLADPVLGDITISPNIFAGPATSVSMRVSSSGPTTVNIFDAANTLLGTQTIPANKGSGSATLINLQAPGIARIEMSGTPTEGCPFEGGGGSTRCIVVDNLSINNTAITLGTLTINDVNIIEGNAGTTNATFTVTLIPANPTGTVSVLFATSNGSATAGTDYTATNGTLNFAPGETSKTISISVVGDVVAEPDEFFTVTLSGVVNATLGKSFGLGTIDDDDGFDDDGKAQPANIVMLLRVNPDREFSIVTGSLLSYTITIKNTGSGVAFFAFARLPIDDNLEIAYAQFSDKKAWVKRIVTAPGSGLKPYVEIGLPVMSSGANLTATVFFRAKKTAKVGSTIFTRSSVFWDDDTARSRSSGSNGVRLVLTGGKSRNDAGGAVQFVKIEQSKSAGSILILRLRADIYIPDEGISFWYTDKERKSFDLGKARADKNGNLVFELNSTKFKTGETYFIAGRGVVSGITGLATLIITT